MEKSELKVGYLVRYRNGELRIVMPVEKSYGFVFINEEGSWMGYEDYNKSLMCIGDKEFDIVEVYGFSKYIPDVLKTNINDRELLWKREGEKEMTISQIEKELGYSIKIIKED